MLENSISGKARRLKTDEYPYRVLKSGSSLGKVGFPYASKGFGVIVTLTVTGTSCALPVPVTVAVCMNTLQYHTEPLRKTYDTKALIAKFCWFGLIVSRTHVGSQTAL
jgi:hypothetical protein